jgi:putative hydrolase of the HAD superfamily
MIKAVFFDFYNTLINYDPPREELEAEALKEFGIAVGPEVFRHPLVIADEFIYREHASSPLSKRSKEEMKVIYARYQEIVLKEAGIDASPGLVGNILGKWQQWKYKLVLFDDVLPTLAQLGGLGLVLGLISNVDHDIAPTCQELGLSALLQVVVTSQGVGFNKPQPEIFLAALKRAGVKPTESIYVGDQHQIDVVGANGAGMRGILLDRYGYFEDIVDSPRISSLTQLVEYL